MYSKLLLATNNANKLREYRSLLQGIQFRLVTPAELGIKNEVEETGNTYEENARLKAVTMAKESGLLALADDAGTEVDALDGEPGIRSHRYIGDNASDKDRNSYLLSRMKDIPWEERTARFCCVIAIAQPDGKVELCHGECKGYITFEPHGEQSFGYDPIFFSPELGKTFGEVTLTEKNKVSHRGKAAQKARLILQKIARGK